MVSDLIFYPVMAIYSAAILGIFLWAWNDWRTERDRARRQAEVERIMFEHRARREAHDGVVCEVAHPGRSHYFPEDGPAWNTTMDKHQRRYWANQEANHG